MSNRSYYSQRAGRAPATVALALTDFKRLFKSHYEQFEDDGYLQQDLGFNCADSGFNPRQLGTGLQARNLALIPETEPVADHITIDRWSEDDLFDMLEFLFDVNTLGKSYVQPAGHLCGGCMGTCQPTNTIALVFSSTRRRVLGRDSQISRQLQLKN